jgi:hypothetical protein
MTNESTQECTKERQEVVRCQRIEALITWIGWIAFIAMIIVIWWLFH